MANIKEEESTSNVLKVHFYVKDNILMDLSESKLSIVTTDNFRNCRP